MNQVIEGDCITAVSNLEDHSLDGVITSPPYNMGKNPYHQSKELYASYIDAKKPAEYIDGMVKLFTGLQSKVKKTGVILLNMSYSSKHASLPLEVVLAIQNRTTWKLRDTITWKKPSAMPLQTSPRNLTRIVEFIFVFAQSDEFVTNKTMTKVNEKTGQKFYGYMDNFVEAPGYDPEVRNINKATFSCDLVSRLIQMYFPAGSMILDPFCGTGTTAISCIRNNCHFIMMDIDHQYCEFSKNRVEKERKIQRRETAEEDLPPKKRKHE